MRLRNRKPKINKAYQIDERISALFLQKGIDVEKDSIIQLKTDMSDEKILCDAYTVLTKDAIATLFVNFALEKDENSSMFSKNKLKTVIYELGWKYIPLDEIEKFVCDQLVSTIRVIYKPKDKEEELYCYSTNHCSKTIFDFFDNVNDYINKGILPEQEDLSDEICPKCGTPYANKHKKLCTKCMGRGNLFKKSLPFFLKYKTEMFFILLTIGISSLLGIIVPYVTGTMLYDQVLTKGHPLYGKILFIVILIALTKLLATAVDVLNCIVTSKVSANVTYDLKKTIFTSFERLSYSFFTSRHTGKLITQINSDANTLYNFFCGGFPYFITNIITFVGILVVMISINPFLTLVAFFPLPIVAFFYYYYLKKFRKLYAENYNKYSKFTSIISDVLNGMRIVKAFSREKTEIKRFDKSSRDYTKTTLYINIKRNTVFPLITSFTTFTTYIFWGIGGYMVMQNSLDPSKGLTYGTFILFTSYFAMLHSPLNFFANFFGDMANTLNAMQRLFEILETDPEISEDENSVDIPEVEGSVEFKDVNFSYLPGKRAITNMSFNIKAGEILGIVGHTGAGKSTIANLLTRLYDPDSGSILIDGIDIKKLSFATLRKNIAIVSQETYLFRGTIFDNIRYAAPNASAEEVIMAAKAAGAHDFIINFADGYNTMVGLDKKMLSGGEKQRISIARAILKDPKILILDEATSAMDTKTESMIKDALSEISKDRTTIMIAHRLSTLRDADRLIVIEDGKLIEEGTHVELLSQKGEYFNLYKLQLEALKTIGIEE